MEGLKRVRGEVWLFGAIVVVMGGVVAIPVGILLATFALVPCMVVLGRRTRFFVPLAVFLPLVLPALFRNGLIVGVGSCIIIGGYVSVYFSLRLKNYLSSIAVNCCTMLTVVLCVFVCAGYSLQTKDVAQIIPSYIRTHSYSDPVLVGLARLSLQSSFEDIDETDGAESVDINFDNIYASTDPTPETVKAVEHLAYIVELDLDKFALEIVFRYAMTLALAGFLIAYASLPLEYDTSLTAANEDQYKFFPEAIKRYRQVNKANYRQPFATLSTPKELFLWVYFPLTGLMWMSMGTPAWAVFAVLWSGVLIVPYAFSGLALCFYFADYVEPRAVSIIIKVALVALMVASLAESLIVFVLSLFGVADNILHTRRLLEKILME